MKRTIARGKSAGIERAPLERMQRPERARANRGKRTKSATRAIDRGGSRVPELEKELEANVADVSTRTLDELDALLAARVLRLDASFEGLQSAANPTLTATRRLRLMLHRGTQFVSGAREEPGSFEGSLAATLRATYEWTLRVLDLHLSGQAPSALATDVESSLVDMIEACEVRSSFDGSAGALRDALRTALQAARALARPRATTPRRR